MKIYVAGKFETRDRVQGVMQRLIAKGHEITHDWTLEDPAGKSGAELARFQQDCACADFGGVRAADLVLVLNHDRLFGGAAEMGMALALGKRVYVVEPQIRDNIFFHLPPAWVQLFPDLESALAVL